MSRRFYLYASHVSAASRCNRKRGKRRRGGEKKERMTERKVKKTARVFRRTPMQFVSHFISGREQSHLPPHPEPSASSDALSMHVRPIHPRGTTATWIISIFAAAKVSQRDYRGATRFHPREKRRELERRGEEGTGCESGDAGL